MKFEADTRYQPFFWAILANSKIVDFLLDIDKKMLNF